MQKKPRKFQLTITWLAIIGCLPMSTIGISAKPSNIKAHFSRCPLLLNQVTLTWFKSKVMNQINKVWCHIQLIPHHDLDPITPFYHHLCLCIWFIMVALLLVRYWVPNMPSQIWFSQVVNGHGSYTMKSMRESPKYEIFLPTMEEKKENHNLRN